MTPTTPAAPAPRGEHPEPAASTAALIRQEAAAWRRLNHALGGELRRRLIPLVNANLVTLDAARQILKDADLRPLPQVWTVRLTLAVTRRTTSTSLDQAAGSHHDDLDRTVRQALGPNVTIAFEQPPHGLAAGPPDSAGHRPYEVWITAPVRAETRTDARAATLKAIHLAVVDLPGVEVHLPDPGAMEVEPDLYASVDLNVDTDAPHEPYLPPPTYTSGNLTRARTARQVAMQAWTDRVRQIRTALINALVNGDIYGQLGQHAPYGLVDDLLCELGLPGLPHAHLYEITTAIPLTVTADNPAAARLAAYHLVRDAVASQQQYGLPIAVSSTSNGPTVVDAGAGSYQVTWHATYLVCLRATHAPRLAEQAVRLQLSVLADDLPDIAAIPLAVAYLGEHPDHLLDPYRD